MLTMEEQVEISEMGDMLSKIGLMLCPPSSALDRRESMSKDLGTMH